MKKIIMLILIIIPAVCFAHDSKRVQANFANDYADCHAYYMLMSEGDEKLKENEGIQFASSHVYEMAVKLSNEGTTDARVELATDVMLRDIQYKWSNNAVIVEKYEKFLSGFN
jgi:hypothetical protein